jgi:hypothetical protein
MKRIWSRQLHQLPNSRSIVSRDLLLIPERNTKLVRVAPETGKTIWEADVQNTWGWLAHNARCAYWLNQHSELQCHELATGRRLWMRSLDGPAGATFGFLVANDRAVLVGGWRGYTDLLCLDAESGADKWSLPAKSQPISMPVPTATGFAIARLDAPTLALVDIDDGRELAHFPLPEHERSPDACPLLGRHGDALLITSSRGDCWALSATAGSHWEIVFSHADGINTIVPFVADDSALFVDSKDQLCCISLANGALQWSAPWRHNRADLIPAARNNSGNLLVGSSFGRLALLRRDGSVLESATVGKRIEGPVAWLGNYSVAFMTTTELIAARMSTE